MTRLAPGDTAPDFTLPDADGNPVALADYRGRKVVVYFYPAAMTPGCTKQACDFRDRLSVLQDAGLAVLGIVGQQVELSETWRFALGRRDRTSEPDSLVFEYRGRTMHQVHLYACRNLRPQVGVSARR